MPTNDRLATAAHYVIARIAPDRLGATKLNKVLWFADCEFYRRHGRSLTGEESYVRKPNGPCVPRFEATLDNLRERGIILERSEPTYAGYPRREFTSLKEPDISCFSAEEVDLLMLVGKEIAKMTAQEASDYSHDALWHEAPANGTLPVAAGAASPSLPTEAELEWGREAFA